MDPETLEIKVLTKKWVTRNPLSFQFNGREIINPFLILPRHRPTLNKPVFVEVQSVDVMTYFTYQIVSQGKLIYSDSVEVPERKYHVFSFLATFNLTPRAHLIVYYFKNDDIISSKINIEIRDELQNFVKLKLSSPQVAPGDIVHINVSSNPRSYIGLMGIDQSVLLLKKNPDITVSSALNERELYQYQFHQKVNIEYETYSPFYFNTYFNDFRVRRILRMNKTNRSRFMIFRFLPFSVRSRAASFCLRMRRKMVNELVFDYFKIFLSNICVNSRISTGIQPNFR